MAGHGIVLDICVGLGRDSQQSAQDDRSRRGSLSILFLSTVPDTFDQAVADIRCQETLVNAFVMSRLDCCNSLCYGINEGLLNKLQHIQNAAARLVTDTRKYDHITPVLRDLHWVPIRQRIVFKLATMVYKCQHGLCPSYLAEDCILLSATRGRLHMRSAGRLELLVPRTRTVTFGSRAFTVAGPGVWNSRPSALREPTLSFNCFRRGLKTFLFR